MNTTLKDGLNMAGWTRLSITAVKNEEAKKKAPDEQDGEANSKRKKAEFRRIESEPDMHESMVSLGDKKEKPKRKAGDVDFDDYMIVLDNYDAEMRKVEEEEKAKR